METKMIKFGENAMAGLKTQFFGISCEGGKKYSQIVRQKFHLTMAALEPNVQPTSTVVSLMVEHAGCNYLLCTLNPESVLQVNLNLYFDRGEQVTFSIKGQGCVHLSGYQLVDESDNVPTPNKNATSIKSPVKKATPAKFVKLPDLSEESEDSIDDEEEDSDELEEESDEGETISPVKKTQPKPSKAAKTARKELDFNSGKKAEKKDVTQAAQKRQIQESSEESSDDEDLSDDLDDIIELDNGSKGVKKNQEKKRPKLDLTSPKKLSSSDSETIFKNMFDAAANSSFSGKKAVLSPAKNKKSEKKAQPNLHSQSLNSVFDLNSSVGRTPMPTKKTLPLTLPPTPSEEVTQSSKKKKKKKKKKSMETAIDSTPGTPATPNVPKMQFSKKLPEGLQYEDIREGSGPVAKKGKLAHVYYTGKLENNKVFDSCQVGSKPFSFKLGQGQVIKGWELGIEGMKVGGKRRLKIPPQLGYKSQRAGDIPPNSTLYFVVELKAVS